MFNTSDAAEWPIALPGTILSFDIDLRHHAVVNIDLMDCGQGVIPLHLSLRRDDGVLIANRLSAKGWHRELVLDCALSASHHEVHLVFAQSLFGKRTVTLWLDGQRLVRLDAMPRPDPTGPRRVRRGFPGLDQIARVSWPAGLSSVRQTALHSMSAPHLNERLEVLWPDAPVDAVLDLQDGEAPVAFLPMTVAGPPELARHCSVLLPGRIWHGSGSEGANLILRGGSDAVPLRITRQDLLSRLTSPQALWQIMHDPILRLNALEHVDHANLWSDLPDASRSVLAAAARMVGLAPPDFVAPMPPAMRPERLSMGEICDRFHARVASEEAVAPLQVLDDLIHAHRLESDEVRQLALLLSEWFCLNHDPLQLAELVTLLGAADWDDRSNWWAAIAGLPMLWAEGNWHAIERILRGYPRHGTGWLVTPALGWLGAALASQRASLAGHVPTLDQRVTLMSCLHELIADLAQSYWAQTPCRHLVSAVLDMLAELPFLPDWCRDWHVECTLRAYGLCAEFWEQFHARADVQENDALARMARGFAALRAALTREKGAVIWEAARPFLILKCAGHDILRRTILSAPALPGAFAKRPDLAHLSPVLSAQEIDETALRWLVFPRSDAIRATISLRPGEPVHAAACRGLRNAAQDIARPYMSQTCSELGKSVNSALILLGQNAPLEQGQAEQITRLARATMHDAAGYLGVAALLALAERAANTEASDLASGWIGALCLEMEKRDPQEVFRSQAAALALERFCALCPDTALVQRVVRWQPVMRAATAPAEDPIAARLRSETNPFADTVVALISCRKNLETRARAARAAWAPGLARLGIPLITVIGRTSDGPTTGQGRFDGELLELDAPDSYEGLPQKSLALVQWVLDQTRFSRVLKIDDDCLLDAEAYFNDPTFLDLPYYGRPLYRAPDAMDRRWHMARSLSARGRMEFDKSPEPSCYADGSTGYLLARPALEVLSAMRQSIRGRRLEQVSFMEDKLIGDLLRLAGISVAGPNYDVAIFRKSATGLPPLPQYESSVLPFAGGGLKLAHLDAGGEVMDRARRALGRPWPNPMKIWPSMVPAATGWAKNALDLVSPPERLEAARSAEVAVIAVMRNERFMLQHFLEHYRGLGVGAFLIVDNGSDDGTLEHLVSEPDVSVFATDTPYSLSTYGVQWQEALMAQFRPGRWSLLADADEFAFWQLPQADGTVMGDLPALLATPDFASAEAVRMLMLDLYPKGPLAAARFTRRPFAEADHIDREPLRRDWQGRGPWSNSETLTSALRHRLMSAAGAPARANLFVAQKYALLKYHPFMRLSAGLHYLAGARCASRDLAFGHFKYHAAFLTKAEEEVARGQHFNNAEEYRAYLALRAEARKTLFDPACSVPLAECPTIMALCDAYNAAKPNSGGITSRSSSTRSAMICASAGAMANPILNPPLNT